MTSHAVAARPARRGVRELMLVAVLYLGYSASRLLADDALAPARERAARLLRLESVGHLDLERDLNALFAAHHHLGLAGSFYYAAAHYVVTFAVLVWLYYQGPERYGPARTALVVATVLGLTAYLTMPTAPPRLVGLTDVLAQHAAAGWWGVDASAPQGLGGLTNQLAAFPSLHAGWALWVALVVGATSISRTARMLAWAHCMLTAVVVVGTGNHWVLDVLAGWAVVTIAWSAVALPDLPTQPPRAAAWRAAASRAASQPNTMPGPSIAP